MNTAARQTILPVIVACIAAAAVAGLGALMTDLGPWYQALAEPTWKPPDWLFGPVWTTIFALTAAGGVLGWQRSRDAAARRRIVSTFTVNAVLNVLWSALFFRLQRPDWALAEVVLLWLSVAGMILVLAGTTRLGALLLVPYLAWVAFAGFLNLAVVRLNGPFG